jgi:hypothetical protein
VVFLTHTHSQKDKNGSREVAIRSFFRLRGTIFVNPGNSTIYLGKFFELKFILKLYQLSALQTFYDFVQ